MRIFHVYDLCKLSCYLATFNDFFNSWGRDIELVSDEKIESRGKRFDFSLDNVLMSGVVLITMRNGESIYSDSNFERRVR